MKTKIAQYLPYLLLILLIPAFSLAAPERPPGLYARIDTSKGTLIARLFYRRAPLTVMNFAGLAEGSIPWAASETGKQRKEPLYKDLKFHLARDFAVQTGDPGGTGRGGPGYLFDDEFHPELHHRKAGMLTMANRGPNTNGSQFMLTRQPTLWLDRRHTVFGEVIEGTEVLDQIERGDEMRRITILRSGPDAESFGSEMAHKLSAANLAALREAAKKHLPENPGEPDPARVPKKGQKVVSPGRFDLVVIGHTGIMGREYLAKTFYYDHEGALEVAGEIVRLARSKGTDFGELIKQYSDMERKIIPELIHDSPRLPTSMKAIFRLTPGQISDPVDMPRGVYIFRRLPVENSTKSDP